MWFACFRFFLDFDSAILHHIRRNLLKFMRSAQISGLNIRIAIIHLLFGPVAEREAMYDQAPF